VVSFGGITDVLLAELVYLEIGGTSADATLAVTAIATQGCLVQLSASALELLN
jgi:hypothetical protein